MGPPPLEPALLEFIANHLDTVDTLEVLLLLAAAPERAWTAQALASERRTSMFAASQRLEHLRAVGLARAADDGFRFDPSTDDVRALVAALDEAYRERRTTVTAAIYARRAPATDALRSFSDAFRIKKDKD